MQRRTEDGDGDDDEGEDEEEGGRAWSITMMYRMCCILFNVRGQLLHFVSSVHMPFVHVQSLQRAPTTRIFPLIIISFRKVAEPA